MKGEISGSGACQYWIRSSCWSHWWFLHAVFGFPGMFIDINTWDHSSLFESMINRENDGRHYIVDGCQKLSCFLSSDSDPSTQLQTKKKHSKKFWGFQNQISLPCPSFADIYIMFLGSYWYTIDDRSMAWQYGDERAIIYNTRPEQILTIVTGMPWMRLMMKV